MLPDDILAVNQIIYALTRGPEGVGKLLDFDLNTCLAPLRAQREDHLVTVIASHGLTYHTRNFTPRWRY